MENNFNNDGFEEFLQNQLKNHRMYPKDTVWRQINQNLHGEKRWPALTVAAFLLISITTLICLHFSSRQNIFSVKPALEPLRGEKLLTLNNIQSTGKQNLSQLFPQTNTLIQVKDDKYTISPARAAEDNNSVSITEAIAANYNDVIAGIKLTEENTNREMISAFADMNKNVAKVVTAAATEEMINGTDENKIYNSSSEQIISATITAMPHNIAMADIVKELPADGNKPAEKNPSLIESFKSSRKTGKFSLLFYTAPSVSYRKLVEDQAVKKGNADDNGPLSVNQVADVNEVVRHKPSKGLEAGLSLLYDLTGKVRLKTGLQFNVRQYTINAYKSNTEVSSIALIDGNRIDTINTYAAYRNYNGNYSAELMNRYYQMSIPLGIEWEVLGNKRFQFNIAGSIQPTFIMNRSAYLLTTNFKNYTEKDEMVRKWNLNSNIEAFVSMNTGDFKWQLGPQIRYQPYSTFIKQYPIKEHLIDYGIKLGVSTRLK